MSNKERSDIPGFDENGKEVSLNTYAGIIALVFGKLASVMFDDGCGDSGKDVISDLSRFLDADTCAEIIEIAIDVDPDAETLGFKNDV